MQYLLFQRSLCEQGAFGPDVKACWAPTTPPGEGVNDGRVESYGCRVDYMCLGSHFMATEAILEQSKDGLLGDSH